jgi:hypothetical protein
MFSDPGYDHRSIRDGNTETQGGYENQMLTALFFADITEAEHGM